MEAAKCSNLQDCPKGSAVPEATASARRRPPSLTTTRRGPRGAREGGSTKRRAHEQSPRSVSNARPRRTAARAGRDARRDPDGVYEAARARAKHRSGLFIFLLLTLLSYVVFRLRNRLRAKALEKGNMEVDDYNAILDERSTAEDEVPTPFGQTSVELSPVSKASSEAAETYKIEFEDIRLFSGADGGSDIQWRFYTVLHPNNSSLPDTACVQINHWFGTSRPSFEIL